ncbi:MAG TPA: hypothetical protein VHE60_07655 [Pyrinomonadaceae bacterium]|nr:hypothetical protein [Pyrinomonadaceae bacterium]
MSSNSTTAAARPEISHHSRAPSALERADCLLASLAIVAKRIINSGSRSYDAQTRFSFEEGKVQDENRKRQKRKLFHDSESGRTLSVDHDLFSVEASKQSNCLKSN